VSQGRKRLKDCHGSLKSSAGQMSAAAMYTPAVMPGTAEMTENTTNLRKTLFSAGRVSKSSANTAVG